MSGNSKYSPKYIKKIDKYLEKCEDETRIFQKMSGKTDGFEEKYNVNLPSVEGFCIYIKVPRRTVYHWKLDNKEFEEALEKIEVIQKKRLMENGLSGKYSPVIAKFLLSANHGLKEKTDMTSDDKPIGAFNDEQIDRIAERITARKRTTGGVSGSK